MKRLATYGLLTGLALACWNYLEFLLGFHANKVGGFTGFVVFLFTFGGITLGVKAYRKQDLGGYISYWQAVMAGVVITFCAALLFAGFTYLYHTAINPGFADFLAERTRRELASHQATASQIATVLRQIRSQYQPGLLALRTFGGFLMGGTVWALILAALLNKEPQP